jgi:hypothetical protein
MTPNCVDIKPTFVPFNLAVLIVSDGSKARFRSAAERIVVLVVDHDAEVSSRLGGRTLES